MKHRIPAACALVTGLALLVVLASSASRSTNGVLASDSKFSGGLGRNALRSIAVADSPTSTQSSMYLPLVFKAEPTSTPTPPPPPSVTPEPPPSPPSTSTPGPTATPTASFRGINILGENFEGDFPGPWEIINANPSSGDYVWGKSPCLSGIGTYGGWAVGGGSDGVKLTCGSNYPNNVDSWMVYGPFDLSDAYSGYFQFQLWMNTEPYADKLYYLVSTDKFNWDGYYKSGTTDGWSYGYLSWSNLPVVKSVLGQPKVWVALRFTSNGSVNQNTGVFVDNIWVYKAVSTRMGVPPAAAETPQAAKEDALADVPVHVVLAKP